MRLPPVILSEAKNPCCGTYDPSSRRSKGDITVQLA